MKPKRLVTLLFVSIFLALLSISANAAETSWLWPVPSKTTITNGRYYQGSDHNGIDIPGTYGSQVVASKSGKVVVVFSGCKNHDAVGSNGIGCDSCGCSPSNGFDTLLGQKVCNYGYGNGIIIDHLDGTFSHYAHLSSTCVTVGQTVSQGDTIGYIGNSGAAAGAHLHFSLASGGQWDYINNNPTNLGYSPGVTYDSPAVVDVEANIPDEAKGFNGNYYAIYTGKYTWEEARDKCYELGGHLVTITSQEEQDFIEALNADNKRLWIGGVRDQDYVFYWITGEPWDYTHWDSGEPNDSSNVVPDENCVAIWPRYWNDLNNKNTSEQSGFICEWEDVHPTVTISSVTANRSTAKPGDSITWTASATGGTGSLRYCFYIFKDGKVVQRGDYGTAKTVTFTPSAAGTYTARVYVKDSSGTAVNLTGGKVTVTAPPPTISSITANKSSAAPGTAITWTASASGGSGTLQYCFYIFKDGTVVQRGNYGSAKSVTFTPAAAGIYTARVYVKDASGTAVNLTGGKVTVATPPPTISSITPNKTSAKPGESITWTASASGGSGTLQYCFYIFKDGTVVQRGNYGSAKSVTFTPAAAGVYTARVYVKDASGTAVNLTGGKVTVASSPLTIGSITANTASAATGATITWTASASGGTGTLQYCFYIFKDGKILERGAYGTARTYSYTPTAAGTYTARVYVKDASGTAVNKTSGNTVVAAAITISSVKSSVASTVHGNPVTWTAAASGGSGSLQYCFYVFKDGKVVQRGAYGSARTVTYTPTAAGKYTVRVYVKDAVGTVATLDNAAAVTVS